jgi:hypothetical protein
MLSIMPCMGFDTPGFSSATTVQGLALVHLQAQRKRFVWDTPRAVSDKRLRLS